MEAKLAELFGKMDIHSFDDKVQPIKTKRELYLEKKAADAKTKKQVLQKLAAFADADGDVPASIAAAAMTQAGLGPGGVTRTSLSALVSALAPSAPVTYDILSNSYLDAQIAIAQGLITELSGKAAAPAGGAVPPPQPAPVSAPAAGSGVPANEKSLGEEILGLKLVSFGRLNPDESSDEEEEEEDDEVDDEALLESFRGFMKQFRGKLDVYLSHKGKHSPAQRADIQRGERIFRESVDGGEQSKHIVAAIQRAPDRNDLVHRMKVIATRIDALHQA